MSTFIHYFICSKSVFLAFPAYFFDAFIIHSKRRSKYIASIAYLSSIKALSFAVSCKTDANYCIPYLLTSMNEIEEEPAIVDIVFFENGA